MDIQRTSAIKIVIVAILLFLIVAVLSGPTVTVHNNITDYVGGDGQYLLRARQEGEAVTFSIVDTKTGTTYIFDRENADLVVPLAPTDALDSAQD